MIYNLKYQQGKLLDFWNESPKFQEKIVNEFIGEILPEHICALIISYDVIAECKGPEVIEAEDNSVEEVNTTAVRDETLDDKLPLEEADETVDPPVEQISDTKSEE